MSHDVRGRGGGRVGGRGGRGGRGGHMNGVNGGHGRNDYGANYVPNEVWRARITLNLCPRCGASNHVLNTCPVQSQLHGHFGRGNQ